jgi:phage FluMu protein Com
MVHTPSPPCVTLPCAPPIVLCLLQGHCATLGWGPLRRPPRILVLPLSYPCAHPLTCNHCCHSYTSAYFSACLSSGCARCVSVNSTTVLAPAGFLVPLVVDFTQCCVSFLGGRVGFSCALCTLPPGCFFLVCPACPVLFVPAVPVQVPR